MTTQIIELETINDQELQIACGGKGSKGKSGGLKKSVKKVANVGVEGMAFGAGEITINQIANAITPSEA